MYFLGSVTAVFSVYFILTKVKKHTLLTISSSNNNNIALIRIGGKFNILVQYYIDSNWCWMAIEKWKSIYLSTSQTYKQLLDWGYQCMAVDQDIGDKYMWFSLACIYILDPSL